MANKKIGIIAVLMVVIMVICAVSAFAASGETDGIRWRTEGERVYLENTNRYSVTFMIQYRPGEDFETCQMSGRSTTHAWISGGTTRVQIFNVKRVN
jgi:hypothetical protein